MIKYVALYRTPADTARFDEDYFRTHVPLANATPGLRRVELARVLKTVTGEPALHIMAELYFDDYDALKAAFRTPEWAASGENLAAWGGLELVSMHIAQVVDDTGEPT